MFRPVRLSMPVMSARRASVTRAQLLTPEILPRIRSRTTGVRPQMPAAATRVTVTVAASVSGVMPSVPPRPVTVRVKVSSVSAASASIVTRVVALAASSNLIVTPLVGAVSAQP